MAELVSEELDDSVLLEVSELVELDEDVEDVEDSVLDVEDEVALVTVVSALLQADTPNAPTRTNEAAVTRLRMAVVDISYSLGLIADCLCDGAPRQFGSASDAILTKTPPWRGFRAV